MINCVNSLIKKIRPTFSFFNLTKYRTEICGFFFFVISSLKRLRSASTSSNKKKKNSTALVLSEQLTLIDGKMEKVNLHIIIRRSRKKGGNTSILKRKKCQCSIDCAYIEYEAKMEEQIVITAINREQENPKMDAHINFVPNTACNSCVIHDGRCSPNVRIKVTPLTTGEIKGYGEQMLYNFGDAIYVRGRVIQFTLTFKKIREYCCGPHALRIIGHSDNKHFEETLWFRVDDA